VNEVEASLSLSINYTEPSASVAYQARAPPTTEAKRSWPYRWVVVVMLWVAWRSWVSGKARSWVYWMVPSSTSTPSPL
jgi:hypothetical protein